MKEPIHCLRRNWTALHAEIRLDYPGEDHERQVVANWDAGFNSRRLNEVNIEPRLTRMLFPVAVAR